MTRVAASKLQSISRYDAALAALVALLALACAGCGSSDDDDDSLQPLSTRGHVAPGSPITLVGNWMIYLEEENSPAGPQDLNGNAFMGDSVAVAVSMGGQTFFPLGVAPFAAHVVGDQLYFEVVEATDGRDWNGDTVLDDVVLLHWAFGAASVPNGMGQCNAEGVCYVDDLRPSANVNSAISAGGRLYYASNVSDLVLTAAGDGATTLRTLAQTAPRLPVEVAHLDTGQRRPLLLGEEAGLLFLAYDETVELANQNGDMDADDNTVLALLDAAQPQRGIQSTGLALPSSTSPIRARRTAAQNDWLVAFFVSEADQGGASLNDRDSPEFMGTAWEPVQCNASPDTDAADVVVHFLHFEPWFADPVLFPPRNTGLVGRDPMGVEPDRLVVVEGFVATASDEASANCDLNFDMDLVDTVVRWTRAVTDPLAPVLPPGDVTELHALATGIAGGSHGLAGLSSGFVIAVDEALDSEDIDGDGQMNVLVASHNPQLPPLTPWRFQHGTGSAIPFVGAAWMAPMESELRLPIAFQESVQGVSLNSACKDLSFADADTTDELPTWPRFSGDVLVFPGVGFGLSPQKGGIVVARSLAFFRVSEAEQQVDLDGDGDTTGFVLALCPVFACEPLVLHTVPDDPSADGTTPAVVTDGLVGAVFVASETESMRDLNGNGFVGEDVLLYFLLP